MVLRRSIILLAALLAAPTMCLAHELYASDFHEALLKAPMGSIRKVGTLTASDFEAVCILHPYQDRLNTSVDLAARVNAHLAKVEYSSDEGHFAFVFVRKQSIEIEKIERSQELDFFGNRKLPTAISDYVPHNFSLEDCVRGPSAAIIKIKFDDRAYFLFGQAP